MHAHICRVATIAFITIDRCSDVCMPQTLKKEAMNFRHIQNEDLVSCNKLVVMAVAALASSTGVAAGTTFASSPAGGT